MTTQNQLQKNNTKNILEKIKNNELVLKPKIYFRVKLAMLIVLLVFIAIVGIFLASFILFSLKASGRASLVDFGPSGWQVFLTLFPWGLASVEIVLVVILEYFLRTFRFGYKIPVLYLFLGVIALMLVSGVVVDQTPLHRAILRQADKEHLPRPFNNLYRDARRPPPRDSGIFIGTVEKIDDLSFVVNLDNPEGRGLSTSVIVNFPDTKMVPEFISGDRILIKGYLKDGYIEVVQIKKIKTF